MFVCFNWIKLQRINTCGGSTNRKTEERGTHRQRTKEDKSNGRNQHSEEVFFWDIWGFRFYTTFYKIVIPIVLLICIHTQLSDLIKVSVLKWFIIKLSSHTNPFQEKLNRAATAMLRLRFLLNIRLIEHKKKSKLSQGNRIVKLQITLEWIALLNVDQIP